MALNKKSDEARARGQVLKTLKILNVAQVSTFAAFFGSCILYLLLKEKILLSFAFAAFGTSFVLAMLRLSVASYNEIRNGKAESRGVQFERTLTFLASTIVICFVLVYLAMFLVPFYLAR